MAQAVAGEKLARPYLGIQFVSITRQLADEQNLPVQAGALVGGRDENGQPVPGVQAGTPAAAAGIKDGDIILSVEGKVIDEGHPLDATLAQFSPGDTVSVEILRDGQRLTLRGHPGDATLGPVSARGPARRTAQASAVAPQAPARSRRSGSPRALQRGASARLAAGADRCADLRWRPARDLHEWQRPNSRSIGRPLQRPDRSGARAAA